MNKKNVMKKIKKVPMSKKGRKLIADALKKSLGEKIYVEKKKDDL